MSENTNYQNNPLHGVSLKPLLTELVSHYGFEILFAYLNINCFKANPSIDSSVKFLKKTDWAREKVEGFYLYEYKNLPKASSTQFALPPRDRVIPAHHSPGKPTELSLDDAERLRQKREKKAAEFNRGGYGARPNSENSRQRNDEYKHRSSPRPSHTSTTSAASNGEAVDPWAHHKK